MQLRPSALRLVERQIRAFQQPFRIVAVRRRQRDADAHRGHDLVPLELHRHRQSGCEAARKFFGFVPAATPAWTTTNSSPPSRADHVVAADHRAQALGDGLEQEVAAVVTRACR